jgi:hypothetical protein
VIVPLKRLKLDKAHNEFTLAGYFPNHAALTNIAAWSIDFGIKNLDLATLHDGDFVDFRGPGNVGLVRFYMSAGSLYVYETRDNANTHFIPASELRSNVKYRLTRYGSILTLEYWDSNYGSKPDAGGLSTASHSMQGAYLAFMMESYPTLSRGSMELQFARIYSGAIPKESAAPNDASPYVGTGVSPLLVWEYDGTFDESAGVVTPASPMSLLRDGIVDNASAVFLDDAAAPVSADAGIDRVARLGQVTKVKGSGGGGVATLTYAWSVFSGSATLANANTTTVSVTPTGAPGVPLVLRLTVSDGFTSATSDVTLNVLAANAARQIMPMGDSTTVGSNGGYRKVLSELLTAASYPHAFVGSYTTGNPPTGFNGSHYALATVSFDNPMFLAGALATELEAHQPEYILLGLGINDTGSGASGAAVLGKLQILLDRIYNLLPSVKVFITGETPYTSIPSGDAQLAIFDSLIPAEVASRNGAGQSAQYVDLRTGFNTATMLGSDNLHPNQLGFDFMGATHKQAIIGGAPPAVPAGVAIFAGSNANVIVWRANGGVNGNLTPAGQTYNLYRSTASNGQDLNAPYKTGIPTPSYCDDEYAGGVTYFYKVRAVSAGGALSAPSAQVSGQPTTRTLPALSDNMRFLLGDVTKWGDHRNPFGWFDYGAEVLGRQWGLDFPSKPPGVDTGGTSMSGTPLAGTVSVQFGSNQVVGVGTSFLSTLAGGGKFIAIEEASGAVRNYTIAAVADDTHLTISGGFNGGTWEWSTASGLSYGKSNFNGENDLYDDANYYSGINARYTMYYRTGDPYWLSEARRYGDSWWRFQYWGAGNQNFNGWSSPRQQDIHGMILTAVDNHPERWAEIVQVADYHWNVWLGSRLDYSDLYYGAREAGYALLNMAQIGKCHTDATVRATYTARALSAAKDYIIRVQRPDGGWTWGDATGSWLYFGSQGFHVGLLLDALQRVYELTNDAAVLNSVLRATQWVKQRMYEASPVRGVPYYSYNWQSPDGGWFRNYPNDAQTAITYYDDLKGIRADNYTVIHENFWCYKQTGHPKYLEWGDEMFDSTFAYTDEIRANVDYSPKQYGESSRTNHRSMFDRLAVVDTTPAPLIPINPAATSLSNTLVKIDWDYLAADATGFVVERKVGAGVWGTVGTPAGALVRSFDDTTVTAGQVVKYRVSAANANGTSAASVETRSVTVGGRVASRLFLKPTSGLVGEQNLGTTRLYDILAFDQFDAPMTGADFPGVGIANLFNGYAHFDFTSGVGVVADGVTPPGGFQPKIVAYLLDNDHLVSNTIEFTVVASGAQTCPMPQVVFQSPVAPPANVAPGSALTIAAVAGAVVPAGVQFTDGILPLGSDNTSPYAATFTPDPTVRSRIRVIANAVDALGRVNYNVAAAPFVSGALDAAPDTTPPTVSIISPSAGATVSGTITITAAAGDNVGVVGVQLKVDGANLGAEYTTAPYSTSWDTTGVADGPHTLTAVARDAAGNQTTSTSVVVTVDNAPPPPPPDPAPRQVEATGTLGFLTEV